MNVLAIGAHPDDLEVLCYGTLVRYRDAGHRVFMCVATNGEAGSTEMSPEEIAGVRRKEAQAAADLIGAKLIWLGFPDEFLFNNRETRMAFLNAIRSAHPDVVLVHTANDYHPDHRAVHQIAVDCRVMVNVPSIHTEAPPMTRLPQYYLMDAVGRMGFEPDDYVDITEQMELKRRALRCHASQVDWLVHHFGIDLLQFVEEHCRARGEQTGCRYAEAFQPLRMWPGDWTRSWLPG